ncbi:hypothetical protein FRC09_006841 [Ceratobasidium sp. 395]|nr:hypothetical protein FRC09_006841 [Ceratobasidium sp. 395]
MLSKLKEKFKGSSGARDAARELEQENALLQLGKYDTQFLIDDSTSMIGSRWNEARDALAGLAKTALKYDNDGIEIFFLNDVNAGKTVKDIVDTRPYTGKRLTAELLVTMLLGGINRRIDKLENV